MKSPSKLKKARAQRLSLKLDSAIESLDQAESSIIQFAEKSNYGHEQCREIGLAVREAVANAVLHGNRRDLNKSVFLTAKMLAGELVISIKDEGKGFDPTRVPDPLAAENILRESGRGLSIIKTLMDDVKLGRTATGATQLTMIKYLPIRPAEGRG